jgi:hypothetical protein
MNKIGVERNNMTHEVVGKWLAGLKSGEFRYRRFSIEYPKYTCALGVLSVVMDCKAPTGRHRYPLEYIGGFQESLVLRLSDYSPTYSYKEVIADIEMALEDYITA